MVAGAFPVAKLATLALKQISKPIATRIKNGAKASPVFRNYVCMPPAQIYHWIEVNVKMRMLNLGKPTDVPKLNETMAIELGAELLGEGVVFAVAAGCLIAEYIRSSNKEREKEDKRQAVITEMGEHVHELELRLSTQEARIQELSRMTYGMHTNIRDWWRKDPKPGDSGKSLDPTSAAGKAAQISDGATPAKVGVLAKAISDVNITLKGRPV